MAVENSLSWYRKLQSIRTRKIFCTEEFIHTWASQFNWVAIFPPCSLKTIPRRKKAIFLDKHFLKGVGGEDRKLQSTKSCTLPNSKHYRQLSVHLLRKSPQEDASPHAPARPAASPPASRAAARSAGSARLSQLRHVLRPVLSCLSH